MNNRILRVSIYQPSAHYRVPFSYQRRFTYPIPPLATVKGLICNLMGIKDDRPEEYKQLFAGLSLAVYGRFESIVKDYTWFRNLAKDSHIAKFHSPENRTHDFTPQHPGGQMPVTVDTLNENHVILYVRHTDCLKQNEIEECFKNPMNRNGAVHLGRSEDWLVIEDIRQISATEKSIRKFHYFTWLPEPESCDESYTADASDNYSAFFDHAPGNRIRMPLFYRITDDNERVFDSFYTAKLYEGGVFPKTCKLFIDDEHEMPIIFTKVRINNGCADSGKE